MIAEYRIPLLSTLPASISQVDSYIPVEFRKIRFFARQDSARRGHYFCASCEYAVGRSFQTASYDFQGSKEIPQFVVNEMHRHVDDHVYIGHAERILSADVVLTKQEALALASILKHSILPKRFDSILRKMGVTPEGSKA